MMGLDLLGWALGGMAMAMLGSAWSPLGGPIGGPLGGLMGGPMGEGPGWAKVVVNLNKVERRGADRVVGINLNYLRDLDVNRVEGARPLKAALGEMGVRWLRYPGGEKSNFHKWSVPPYRVAKSEALEWYATVEGERMDFDQYMKLVREVGAEPYVVVGLDSTGRSKRSRAEWLADAVAWVRYANVEKKYGVRYWEVGNENWMEGRLGAAETGKVVREFGEAMKSVDPTILVGTNGKGGVAEWWGPMLGEAGGTLDFVSMSLYNTWEWGGYQYWVRNPGVDLIGDVRRTLELVDRFVPVGKKGTIELVVAETNSKDYSKGGWAGENSLGHALVTFETLARLSGEARVAGAMVWNTRWVKDAEAALDQFYALGPKNEPLPTGRAVEAWAGAVLPVMVAASVQGGGGNVAAYAARSEDGKEAVVWVVNRGMGGVTVEVEAEGMRAKALRQLSGTGEGDANPVWREGGLELLVKCPGVSITVVRMERRGD